MGRFRIESLSERAGNPEPPRLSQNEDPRRPLHDAVEVIRRGRWYVVVVFAAFVAGAYLYTVLQTPEYEATTIVLVETKRPVATASGIVDPGFSTGLESNDRSLSNQLLLLRQSLPIAERTAERLLALGSLPDTGEPLPVLQTEGDEPLRAADLAVHLQRDIVSINLADTEADALQISARSSSPEEAALIANIYAQEYVKRTQETSRLRISASRRFLEEQVAKYRVQLGATEERVQQYMGGQKAVALNEEAQHTISQIAQLEAQQDEARIEQSMHEASLEALEDELQQIHPGLTRRVASGVEREIELSQGKIAELELFVEQIYQANPEQRRQKTNGELQALLDQIQALRQRVGELSQQYVDEVLAAGGIDLRNDDAGMAYIMELRQRMAEERIAISGAEAKVEALGRRLREYRRRLNSIPEHSIQLAQLQRSRQSAEQLYVNLTEKLQEARLAEEAELGFAYIVRRALAPSTPVHPDTRRTMSLGLLVGLLFGLGAAFTRHRLDTRIYTPDDLIEHGFPVIGTIPDLRYYVERDQAADNRILIDDGWRVSDKMMLLHHPFSSAAEAYRHLYINLNRTTAPRPVRTVLVTSSEAGAGKSTTAANLALAAAQAGQRTLLIDADAYRPTVQSLLGVEAEVQLEDLLHDEAGRPHLNGFNPSRLATPVSNVYVLGVSDTVGTGSTHIRSSRLRQLMVELTDHFDHIIVDSSPVLGTTDALVLSGLCEVTVLVVASGTTPSAALRQSAADLRDAGGRVVGTVLNAFDPRHMLAYASTYHYRYQYSRHTPKQIPAQSVTPPSPSPS